MKFLKHILLLFILVVAEFVSAQEEFSFQLYFEDAIGQRDTITLGYDPLATDTIDTAFGEVNILNQPWSDSTLDVRIGDMTYQAYPLEWLSTNSYLTKKQILTSFCYGDPNYDFNSSSVSLNFKVQYLPIKISWDYSLFNGNCVWKSSFYGNVYSTGWYGSGTLLYSNSGDLFLDYNTIASNPAPFVIERSGIYGNTVAQSIQSYKNNGDTIAVLQFAFFGGGTIGLDKNNKLSTIDIYPNPTSDIVTIDIENNEQSELLIYQLDGTLIRKQTLLSNSNNISISDLNTGVYLFKIDSDKEMTTKKVIKN